MQQNYEIAYTTHPELTYHWTSNSTNLSDGMSILDKLRKLLTVNDCECSFPAKSMYFDKHYNVVTEVIGSTAECV